MYWFGFQISTLLKSRDLGIYRDMIEPNSSNSLIAQLFLLQELSLDISITFYILQVGDYLLWSELGAKCWGNNQQIYMPSILNPKLFLLELG